MTETAAVGGPRPGRVVLVTGTGTEIGKTWASARTLEAARARGVTVAARKPAQSFDPADAPRHLTDADLLGAASGETPTTVCPAHRWYAVPMAPPMAAEVLFRDPFTIADLVAEVAWPDHDVTLGLVETAGGVRSPMAADGDAVTFARSIGADLVVLVADAGLGTINAVRLSIDALREAVPDPDRFVVLLNHFDDTHDLHVRNRAFLQDRLGLRCVTDIERLTDAALGDSIDDGLEDPIGDPLAR
jgi:dethiobiotin synthetase